MTVVDASAVTEFVLGRERSEAAAAVAERVRRRAELAAPHLLDAEVGQAIRRLARRDVLSVGDARAALRDLTAMTIQRYPHDALLGRAFDLRHNATFYDAIYLALAEALDSPMLTGDARLADIPGCTATVEVVSTWAHQGPA